MREHKPGLGRKRGRERKRERDRDRESQVGSTVSTEHLVGLELRMGRTCTQNIKWSRKWLGFPERGCHQDQKRWDIESTGPIISNAIMTSWDALM